jgi:hypothetical protein
VLRLRGLDVTTFGNTMPPFLNSRLIEELGARYVSTKELSLSEGSAKYGPFDLILEGTGYSPLVFEAMNVLAKNGVLAMVSVTGGSRQMTPYSARNLLRKLLCRCRDPRGQDQSRLCPGEQGCFWQRERKP